MGSTSTPCRLTSPRNSIVALCEETTLAKYRFGFVDGALAGRGLWGNEKYEHEGEKGEQMSKPQIDCDKEAERLWRRIRRLFAAERERRLKRRAYARTRRAARAAHWESWPQYLRKPSPQPAAVISAVGQQRPFAPQKIASVFTAELRNCARDRSAPLLPTRLRRAPPLIVQPRWLLPSFISASSSDRQRGTILRTMRKLFQPVTECLQPALLSKLVLARQGFDYRKSFPNLIPRD
jgi:hypothetical protein